MTTMDGMLQWKGKSMGDLSLSVFLFVCLFSPAVLTFFTMLLEMFSLPFLFLPWAYLSFSNILTFLEPL